MNTNNINIPILLVAIAAIESNHNDAAVGKDGERGRYQISMAVWNECTVQPFLLAHDWMVAHWVAQRHIMCNIIPQLHARNIHITIEAIAGCWNAGVRGYCELERGRDYAKRVAAYYEHLTNPTTHEREFTVSP